jgi:hypothetical protein
MAGSTTVATLLLMVLADDEPVTDMLEDTADTVIVAVLL